MPIEVSCPCEMPPGDLHRVAGSCVDVPYIPVTIPVTECEFGGTWSDEIAIVTAPDMRVSADLVVRTVPADARQHADDFCTFVHSVVV